MTLRELVFMCMDELKLNSDDSFYTEDHIVFLLNKYRSFVLKGVLEKENKPLSNSNSQVIKIPLVEYVDGASFCKEPILRSEIKIPTLVNDTKVSLYPVNYLIGERIIYTSIERLRFVSYNKWTKNLIYAAKGPDDYLYLSSCNPQYKYLEEVTMKAIFEDFEEASEYASNEEGEPVICDHLDMQFPIESALVPMLIGYVLKELLGASYRPKDSVNNADDDLSDIIAWARRNMKTGLQKQIENGE